MKFISMLTLVFFMTALAEKGKESGGGDAVVQEFVTLGREVAFYLKSKRIILSSEIKIDEFTKTLEKADIVSVEHAFLMVETPSGQELREVDAVNHPPINKIEVSRFRWKDMPVTSKMALVLHEVLALMDLNDKRYQISHDFLKQLATTSDEALLSKVVDDISERCGDTWCETDFDFNFRYMSWKGEEGCRLHFDMADLSIEFFERNTQLEGRGFDASISEARIGKIRKYEVSCLFKDYIRPDSFVSYSALEQKLITKREGYNVVDDCIHHLMATLEAEIRSIRK